MDKTKISAANLVILIAGGVMLIASFLAFRKISIPSFDVGGAHIGGGSKSFNAWSTGLFIIATIPALLGTLMAVHVALESFAPQVTLPDRILGLTWSQVHLVLAVQSTIMMLAFLIQDTGAFNKGVGLFLMLIAAIALVVGAAMRLQEQRGPNSFG
jgi:hypothetical protein